MKSYRFLLSSMIVAVACSGANAQEPFQPLPEHEVIMQEVGTWNASGKLWMPGAPETEFEAVEVNKSIGGMWITSDFKGDFFGQPFVGHATTGYDMKSKKYVGTWFDSMNPYMSKMVGSYDADTKTMTFNTTTIDAASGNEQKGKNVVVYKDANTRIMTMYMPNPEKPGEMMKGMELVYTRKKTEGSASKGSGKK